jgi:hypothetical protein
MVTGIDPAAAPSGRACAGQAFELGLDALIVGLRHQLSEIDGAEGPEGPPRPGPGELACRQGASQHDPAGQLQEKPANRPGHAAWASKDRE